MARLTAICTLIAGFAFLVAYDGETLPRTYRVTDRVTHCRDPWGDHAWANDHRDPSSTCRQPVRHGLAQNDSLSSRPHPHRARCIRRRQLKAEWLSAVQPAPSRGALIGGSWTWRMWKGCSGRVFSGLGDQVTIYPSENYYYFILFVDGRQIWGNMRLPTRSRDNGVLSFAYFQFNEFPSIASERFVRTKFFSQEDGLILSKVDRFTYRVNFRGKAVTFNLHQLSQDPPRLFPLGENEVFVERTVDESGYQFFLLFNEESNYFLWVLNEEEGVSDILEPLGDAPDLLIGKRSGFAFWIDQAHGDRKVLASVRSLNVQRNDYYDGPFDQLADNYVDETEISEYMQRALPGLRGADRQVRLLHRPGTSTAGGPIQPLFLHHPRQPPAVHGQRQGGRRPVRVHLSKGQARPNAAYTNSDLLKPDYSPSPLTLPTPRPPGQGSRP